MRSTHPSGRGRLRASAWTTRTVMFVFFFQAEDGIRDGHVTGVQTCALPIYEKLLNATINGIARLNRRHGPAPNGGERFLLFHRRRGWNEGERKWIGWERKRGKLHELNRLLRGATETTFLPDNGESPHVPEGVRYV